MDMKTENNAAAVLRAQLESELKNKKQCAYTSYECTQLSLDGYKFCYKHILQDKNAPYKQCHYIYNNSKKCQLPAPRTEKKDYGYCNEHALRATLARTKQNAKCPPPNTAEVLLCSLSHYIKKPKLQIASNTKQPEECPTTPDDGVELKNVKYLDPFVDLDAVSIDNGQCNDVLDFGSESESDIEPSTLASVWQDAHVESSDDESIDSEQEDLLKHANVYTAEEATVVTRDKLVRLQALYVEQYRYLQHLLKEKRRRYLHALKRQKETCCNIYNQVRDNPKEQRLYKKLKALNNYQKPHGVDAILNKRVRDIRAKIIDGSVVKGSSYTKCLFSEGGVKCGERSIPLARHCRKHILEDTNQVLFKACGKVNGDIECNTPIAAIFDDSYCQLHMEIPALRSYCQIRKDSESDLDDSAESHLHYPHFSETIKTEYIHYDIPPELPKMEKLPSLLFEESSQSMTSDADQPNESMFDGTFGGAMCHGMSDDHYDIEMKPSYPEDNPQPSDREQTAEPNENIEDSVSEIGTEEVDLKNIINGDLGEINAENEPTNMEVECKDEKIPVQKEAAEELKIEGVVEEIKEEVDMKPDIDEIIDQAREA